MAEPIDEKLIAFRKQIAEFNQDMLTSERAPAGVREEKITKNTPEGQLSSKALIGYDVVGRMTHGIVEFVQPDGKGGKIPLALPLTLQGLVSIDAQEKALAQLKTQLSDPKLAAELNASVGKSTLFSFEAAKAYVPVIHSKLMAAGVKFNDATQITRKVVDASDDGIMTGIERAEINKALADHKVNLKLEKPPAEATSQTPGYVPPPLPQAPPAQPPRNR